MEETHVSVRELKNRLSHFLRLVKAGQPVVITERGVPVGRVVATGPGLDARLAAMCEAGQMQWNGHKLPPAKPAARVRGRRTVAQLLVEDRQ